MSEAAVMNLEEIRNRKPQGLITATAPKAGYSDFVLLTVEERDELIAELEQARESLASQEGTN